jgi:hypothetical protein
VTRMRVLTLARKARAMPPGQLAGIARTRLNNRFRALAWKRLGWTPARGRSVSPAMAGQAAAAAARLLLGDRASELREWLRRRPESAARVLARAEEVMAHRTSLLGSDRAPLGDPIDWHRDWVTGTAWPREHFSELDLLKLDERCDVKRCWDLSRAYHWVWLAQAFWLTDDRRFLDEIERQWHDWLDRNPPEIGVNWANPMEASIRSVSWWWVLALTAGRLDAQLSSRVCGSLQTHLDYILGHLEFAGDGRNSNHLLADYVGLSFGGLIFADHPSSPAWRDAGLAGLWRELPLQVYPDGVNYEQSSEYHRVIAEFFLYTALLARRAGHDPRPEAWERLERMLEVCMHMTRPDGLANAIGDGDDGRLFWLTDRSPLDFRGLLAVGAVVFDRGDFRHVAGVAAGAGEDPLDDLAWTLGVAGVDAFDRISAQVPASTTAAFSDGGVYVARTDWTATATHVVIDAGHLGMGPEGRGSHGHADTLSLCVSLRGQPVVIDPGTGIYTGDVEWRDAFRGGRMHNGVTVDGLGVCAFDDGPFRWSTLCTPRVERWEESAGWVRFSGSHDGFERIASGLRHRRSIWMCRTRDAVIVHDRLDGGPHRLDAWFQFPAGAGVQRTNASGGAWFAREGDASGVLVPRRLTDTRVYSADEQERLGWVSPSYGRWQAGATLRVTAAQPLAEIVTIVTPLSIAPGELLSAARAGADPELAALLETWF